jgi:hypothetical protein
MNDPNRDTGTYFTALVFVALVAVLLVIVRA